jgi:chromosomal replication initiation ATPase DnaA
MKVLQRQRLATRRSAGKGRYAAVPMRGREDSGTVSGTDSRAVPGKFVRVLQSTLSKADSGAVPDAQDPGGSWYLTGPYGSGKTHLLYAQYRELVTAGQVRCQVRTTRELVEELRRAEFDEDFVSLVVALLPGVTRTTCSGTTSTS